MIVRFPCWFLAALVAVLACGAVAGAEDIPAFPGAEGFGAHASGGRGGEVYYVTNLNDNGPGSLRDGIGENDRTILFQVSGTIQLESTLAIRSSNITIAGQTAPGDGICLRDKGVVLGGDNVIVRFLRMRPGDERGEEHDALTIQGSNRFIVDHCSLSWSVDSVNDVVRETTNGTVQWCIVAEPLNDSVHEKGPHGYGTGWGSGRRGGNSFHHNLIAHCNSRAPRIGSEHRALVDIRNNVVYNTGSGWAYGGENARVNYVANYFKPGPSTLHRDKLYRIGTAETRMFLDGNVVDGFPDVAADNSEGLAADDGVDPSAAVVHEPFDVPPVRTQPAAQAYELVLEYVGAILPKRDAVDRRVLGDARMGTGQIIDSQDEVGGWPELASAAPRLDSDGDGLPDEWELANGLDPRDGADGSVFQSDGYTNLEHYLNDLAAVALPGVRADRQPGAEE
jgi:pectate lyase